MLVLGREIGDTITITGPDGTVIELTIVDIRRLKMRIGIDAPKEWKIVRDDAKIGEQ